MLCTLGNDYMLQLVGFVCRLLWSHPVKWKRFLYSVFCLCNPHVMWILSWYFRIHLSSSKKFRCTNSSGSTDTERLFLLALFLLFLGHGTICGSQSTWDSQRFSGRWIFSALSKTLPRRLQHFLLYHSLVQQDLLHLFGDCSVTVRVS